MLFTTPYRPSKRGEVAVSGNVYFPQWRRFSRLPDGYAAPSDAVFVASMAVGLVLYLTVAILVLACGMAFYAVGYAARLCGRQMRRASLLSRA